MNAAQLMAFDEMLAALRRYIDDDGDDALRGLYHTLAAVEDAHGARTLACARLGRELLRQGIISEL